MHELDRVDPRSVELRERAPVEHGVIANGQSRHDDVVDDGDPDRFRSAHDRRRGRDVLLARRRIAARMIVPHDHCGCTGCERCPQNNPHIDRRDAVLTPDRRNVGPGDVVMTVDEETSEMLAIGQADAGVQLLFTRSAKLAQGEFTGLAEISILEGSTPLRERLQEQESPLAPESAEALFGTFFALIATFIGERLTNQMLRRAWPTIEEMATEETRNER